MSRTKFESFTNKEASGGKGVFHKRHAATKVAPSAKQKRASTSRKAESDGA